MGMILRALNPELFQGSLRRRRYFEGWYFKLIGADRRTAAAVIPGVALGGAKGSPDSHAFVQFILGDRAEYYRFPLEAFQAEGRALRIGIGKSVFSLQGVSLDLGEGERRLAGELAFTEALPYPKRLIWPGVMGPFGFVPGMECYHAVASLRHTLSGRLRYAGRDLDFTGGSGYVEKDWGRSFPKAWIWLQAGHFESGAALLFSVADIPWMGSAFRGFFALLHDGNTLHRFATYDGARIEELAERGAETAVVIRRGGRTLEISARTSPGGLLLAPKNGLMDRVIEETIAAQVRVRLTDRHGVLFEGESPCAGMERYAHETLLGGGAR